MKDNINQNLPKCSGENKGKNTNNSESKHLTERPMFCFFLKKKTATVFQIEKEISRRNGCRSKTYCQDLVLLQVVKIGKCLITSEDGVQFITTNEMWFTDDMQLPIPFNPPNQ